MIVRSTSIEYVTTHTMRSSDMCSVTTTFAVGELGNILHNNATDTPAGGR